MTVAITMTCTFDSAAQLKVMQNGQIRVGDTETLTSGGIVRYGGDFMLSFYGADRLPHFEWVANNSLLSNNTKRFVVRDVALTNVFNPDNYAYRISSGGNLDLVATRNFTSKKAFDISNGGKVNLSSYYGNVVLESDNIQEGGELQVSSKETTLKNGFSVAKGGELTITPER